jgi:hypothetical protein
MLHFIYAFAPGPWGCFHLMDASGWGVTHWWSSCEALGWILTAKIKKKIFFNVAINLCICQVW